VEFLTSETRCKKTAKKIFRKALFLTIRFAYTCHRRQKFCNGRIKNVQRRAEAAKRNATRINGAIQDRQGFFTAFICKKRARRKGLKGQQQHNMLTKIAMPL